MTGLAYLLGVMHGQAGRAPITWPQVKADVLWIGREFRFDVEQGRSRYLDAYQQGYTAGTQIEDTMSSR